MRVHFYKYQGTGNDFIIIDEREKKIVLNDIQVAALCNRRFGIGADGLMSLGTHKYLNFTMKYYNADGKEGSMCGNGGRSMVSFAHRLGLITDKAHFSAIDGAHEALVTGKEHIRLKMADVSDIQQSKGTFFLDTGSPHYVEFVSEVSSIEVVELGRKLRYADRFQPAGTNVNFVQILEDDSLFVRTYERGVEDETLSCGTGSTASALSASIFQNSDKSSYQIKTLGGLLTVSFRKLPGMKFTDVYLEGPANFVFEGDIDI
jgi:diaminopimelate epimerase